MIPQERSAAVTRGLREAFGVSAFQDIRQITKGRGSTLVFRIVVEGRPLLLRIMQTNSLLGPERQFTCMKAAAEAGLAPHVWYISIKDQISISDFVEETPFPAPEAPIRMATTLRALHALPPFPRGVNHLDTTCMFLINQGSGANEFIAKFQAANILSECATEELLTLHAQAAAVYRRRDSDMVSSHNDLFKPDNILFDGQRVWLVDWEAAFLNDRYADLAVVANLVVANEAEQSAYLHEYFGQPPDQYQLARFYFTKQVAHIFYAMVFLFLGSPDQPVNESEDAPEFGGFQRRIWAGEVNLADKQMKTAYGRVHLRELLQNSQQARFHETLKIVSDGHA